MFALSPARQYIQTSRMKPWIRCTRWSWRRVPDDDGLFVATTTAPVPFTAGGAAPATIERPAAVRRHPFPVACLRKAIWRLSGLADGAARCACPELRHVLRVDVSVFDGAAIPALALIAARAAARANQNGASVCLRNRRSMTSPCGDLHQKKPQQNDTPAPPPTRHTLGVEARASCHSQRAGHCSSPDTLLANGCQVFKRGRSSAEQSAGSMPAWSNASRTQLSA